MGSRSPFLLTCALVAAFGLFGQTVTTLIGTLRQISDDKAVIETDKKTVLTVVLGITTKYYKGSTAGAMITSGDFHPGDHLSIEATPDDKSVYRARSLSLIRPGTPSERAAAEKPVANQEFRPDDAATPVLRRGIPKNKPAHDADSRPGILAAEVNGVTRPPEPPKVDPNAAGVRVVDSENGRYIIPGSGDEVIDNAREAAFRYSETLPNFIVKQYTTRYGSESAKGGQISWRTYDTVTADVVSENGYETYRNVLIDGKPPKDDVEKTGAWSTGEYSNVLLDILATATHADFHGRRAATISNRAAWRYDFVIAKENSHWRINTTTDSYEPGYSGTIWFDRESSRALRIELEAQNMPATFKLDNVQSAVDYDFVEIGEGKFLLPVHAESLSCERGSNYCSRNVIDFRNYRKFTADTSITFGDDSPK